METKLAAIEVNEENCGRGIVDAMVPISVPVDNFATAPGAGETTKNRLADDVGVYVERDVENVNHIVDKLVSGPTPALNMSPQNRTIIVTSMKEDLQVTEISKLSDGEGIDTSTLQNNSTSPVDGSALDENFDCNLLSDNKQSTINSTATPVIRRTNATDSGTSCVAALPIDALHCIASFLKPREWCNGFGLVNKAALVQCREVIRRIRLHGFRCATEVVTAYKVGQIADSKELAALYVATGVPLYAACLGHSYHTLYWRISVEHKQQLQQQMQTQQQVDPVVERTQTDSDDSGATQELRLIDPYYSGRQDFRTRNWYCKKLTYLEEKSLFYAERHESNPTNSISRSRGMQVTDTFYRLDSSDINNASKSVSTSANIAPVFAAKIPMPIHQHLLDRHERGDIGVHDYEGKMKTPPISLSAEFFHPSGSKLNDNNKHQRSNIQVNVRNYGDVIVSPSYSNSIHPNSNRNTGDGFDSGRLNASSLYQQPGRFGNDDGDLAGNDENDEIEPFQPPLHPTIPISRLRAVLQSVQMQVYSSTSYQDLQATYNPCNMNNTSHNEIMWHLRSRFATYQRRLENILSQCGSQITVLFEECLLDFWDEFFPHTADIHYYDTETAVPRLSKLKKFLSKPCPQAIGIVQCEIERVRIESRGKGVKMTGRFFPVYEYRLFIRNKQISSFVDYSSEDSDGNDNDEAMRRDSVLMVAKHDTLRRVETIVTPVKKGANNYYLYMPNQEDVDDHYSLVNNITVDSKQKSNQPTLNPNGRLK
jgi:hypothetical protein